MTGIARDDLALDAIATGQRPVGDDEVLDLLYAFRADLEPEAEVVPLRRPRRRGALIALSAAAGLVLGGLTAGAVVSADQPGQLFYAAHKAVLGDPKAADRVTKLLDDAAEEIAEGDLRNARDRLDKAAGRLGEVEDPAERNALRTRLDNLLVLAAAPSPSATTRSEVSETPEPRESETPEPLETESPGDSSGRGSDNAGKGSSNSGSGGSGSDD